MNILKFFILILMFKFNIGDNQLQRPPNSTFVTTTKVTTLLPTIERIFSRKRRFVLMPKGGTLKYTTQLAKRLISTVPSGFNFVIEIAFYYPGVSSRIDLIPKRLRKPTTPKPKPTGTTPKLFVCVPGSLICWKARPATKPPKVQRIDEGKVQWIDSPKLENFTNSAQWTKWSKYNTPTFKPKYTWTPAKEAEYQQQWQRHEATTKWNKWTTLPPNIRKWQQQADTEWWPQGNQQSQKWERRRWKRYDTDAYNIEMDGLEYDEVYDDRMKEFPELEPFEDWKHYHSHRDRRQLFYQFEGLTKLIGFDMKYCILRTICESKRLLLPPGYSLVQDILRLIFTFPTINGLEDEYSRAMRADDTTCAKRFESKCSISLLHWFLSSRKG